MKLRTARNSIRLRLSQADVRALAERGHVEEVVSIGPGDGQEFSYRLVRGESASAVSVSFENNRLAVIVPAKLADDWVNSETVGIDARQPNGEAEQLRILIEKDFACLGDRPGGDDDDTFPNPAASSEKQDH